MGPPRPPAGGGSDSEGEEDEPAARQGGGGGEEADPYNLPVTHEVVLTGHTRLVSALDIEHTGSRLVTGGCARRAGPRRRPRVLTPAAPRPAILLAAMTLACGCTTLRA